MIAMIHQESCSVAGAIVIAQYRSHPIETGTGKMTWRRSEKDRETETAKRVEAERGMIMTEIGVKKEIEIGEDEQNKNPFYQILATKCNYRSCTTVAQAGGGLSQSRDDVMEKNQHIVIFVTSSCFKKNRVLMLWRERGIFLILCMVRC